VSTVSVRLSLLLRRCRMLLGRRLGGSALLGLLLGRGLGGSALLGLLLGIRCSTPSSTWYSNASSPCWAKAQCSSTRPTRAWNHGCSSTSKTGRADVELLLRDGGFDIVSVTPQQAEIAVDAFRRFGRGRHPAALNIGDCFAYALAVATDHTLLFKGDDFTHTDIRPALPPAPWTA
jgi:uncharacterized protein with PIN domain